MYNILSKYIQYIKDVYIFLLENRTKNTNSEHTVCDKHHVLRHIKLIDVIFKYMPQSHFVRLFLNAKP